MNPIKSFILKKQFSKMKKTEINKDIEIFNNLPPCLERKFAKCGKEIQDMVQPYREVQKEPIIDPDYMIKNRHEGKNTSKSGKEFWLCGHCEVVMTFKNRDEYLIHHARYHS